MLIELFSSVLQEARVLNAIKQCVFCGCADVPPAELEVRLKSKYIKVQGAKCSQCEEEYYDIETLIAVEELEKLGE